MSKFIVTLEFEVEATTPKEAEYYVAGILAQGERSTGWELNLRKSTAVAS